MRCSVGEFRNWSRVSVPIARGKPADQRRVQDAMTEELTQHDTVHAGHATVLPYLPSSH